ncbi:MAG: hypothetical protein H6718_09780 [Polyangiaceae bacterium]|nr:hypothetical protein [Myxococcales bacterium]MCB9585678.1 hypothetical protein [Polyangiaceae bacterium]MCB9607393.1 hypothetical protein [Polyangiaceae bacterium]
MKESQRKFVLLSIPGSVAWGFVIAGFAADSNTLKGIGGTIMISMVVIGLTMKAIDASKESKERRELQARGEPGTAKVLKISSRGGGINDHPLVQFELEVTFKGQTYQGLTEAIIDQLAIPRIQPGCEVKVIVDPEDRSSILIDAELTPYGHH